MMEDNLFLRVCVILLFFLGFVIGMGLANDSIIQQCEKNLPRSQHCKVIAVPEESKQD